MTTYHIETTQYCPYNAITVDLPKETTSLLRQLTLLQDNQFVVSAPGHSANRGLLASVSTVGVTSDTRFTLGTPAGVNNVNVDLYQGTQGGGERGRKVH